MKNAVREDALTVGVIHQRNSGKNNSSYVWIIRIGSCRPWSSVDSVLKIIPLRQRGNAGPDSKGQCENDGRQGNNANSLETFHGPHDHAA